MNKKVLEILTDDDTTVTIPYSKISSVELKGQKLTINTVASDWYTYSRAGSDNIYRDICKHLK